MSAIFKILFSLALLILSAFVQIPLVQYEFASDKFVLFNYALTYLVCFLLSISFKNNYSFIAVILYLILGILGLPFFAFGGGFHYLLEPSFGYLLGLIPLSVTAFYFQLHDSRSSLKFLGVNLSPLLGILFAHLLGLFVLLITARLNFENFLNLSGMQLCYDLLFSYFALVFIKNPTVKME